MFSPFLFQEHVNVFIKKIFSVPPKSPISQETDNKISNAGIT